MFIIEIETNNNHILRKQFKEGVKVLLYDSRLHVVLSKLKSRWTGPFRVTEVFHNGAVTIENPNTKENFKVNGQRLKSLVEPVKEYEGELALSNAPNPG